MIIIQIIVGVLVAVGVGAILIDVLHIPTLKAQKAVSNLGKKGDKKVSVVEIYLKDFSVFLSKHLKLNEYKRAQLEADLRTAGMEITPERYVSDALTKALCLGVFAIPAFFVFKIAAAVVLLMVIGGNIVRQIGELFVDINVRALPLQLMNDTASNSESLVLDGI